MNVTFFPCATCGCTNCVDSETWEPKKFDSIANKLVNAGNKCECGELLEGKASLQARSEASAMEFHNKEKALMNRDCKCDAVTTVKTETSKKVHLAVNRDALKVKKENLKKASDDLRISKNVEKAKQQEEAKLKAEEEKLKAEESKTK